MNYSQDSQDFERPVRCEGGWVQTGARIKPHIDVKELVAKDELLSVFSGSQEDGRIVVTTRNGLKQSVVNNRFKKDEDLQSFRESFKDKIETFKFDQVFGMQTNQDKLYNTYFSEATKQLFSGTNASFLVYGPSGAGKSFSFSGNEATNQKGIVFKACEELLQNTSPHLFGGAGPNSANSTQKSRQASQGQLAPKSPNLKISIYSMYSDEVFDLLQNFSPKNIKQSIRELHEKSSVEVKIVNITKKDIKMVSDFKQIYSQAIQNLLQLGEQLKEQNFYGKSHIVVQFEVQTNIVEESSSGKEKNKTAKLTVVRLADTDVYENTQESVRNDFVVLKKYLNHCSRYHEISSTYKIYKQSKFSFALRESLNELSNIRLLCCVSTNPSTFINSIKTIEFFGRMTTGQDKSLLQQSQQSAHKRWATQEDGRQSRHQQSINNMQSAQKQQEIAAQNQKEIESIIVDAENLVTDLTKNQANIPNLSLREKNAWIGEKSAQHKELIGSLDVNSYNQPLNLVNYCESLLQNAGRLISRMASPNRFSQNLRNFNESSDEDVQAIKQKIDTQIHRLQENKLQENKLDRSREYVSSYASPNRLNSSILKSTHQRMSTLTSPINRTFRNYSVNQSVQHDINQQKVEALNDEKDKLASSLSNLKKSMQLKEDIDYQKRRQDELEKRNIDVKFKDQVIRNQDLEEQVKKKEQVIHQIDREMKNCQDDLLYNMEKMREMEIKHENWVRLEEQLRENNESLKLKMLKKKKKIQSLKLNIQSKNRDYQDLEINSSQRVEGLQRLLNECQGSLEQTQRTSYDLGEEIELLRKKLEIKDEQVERFGQEIENLRLSNQRLASKCEMELNEKLERESQVKSYQLRLEEKAKLQKMRTQFDMERDEYKKQVDHLRKTRKDKIKKFKQFINEQDEKIMQLESEKHQQETHYQQSQVDSVDQKKEIEQLRENLKEVTNEIVITKQNSYNYQIEVERLQNLVTSLENKIKNLEGGALEDARKIQQLRQQLEQEEIQSVELRSYNNKLEQDIQDLEDKQNDEITTIEKQIDQLIIEINSSKALNEEYKIKEEGYRKQIISLNDLIEAYKEKYYKSKHANKALKSQIKNMEDKFKSLETQRLLDLKELEKQKISQRLQEHKENKLKVIDEIQGLIQTHKKVRLYNN